MGNVRYVYLIEAENLKLTKIGLAINPRLRLSELQTGNPSRLRLRYVLSSTDPEKLERTLHHLFADWRHHGEWFSLLSDDILEQIKGHTEVQAFVTGDNWRPKPYDFTPKATMASKSNVYFVPKDSDDSLDSVHGQQHHVIPTVVKPWSQEEYGRTLRNHWKWQTEHSLKSQSKRCSMFLP